MGVGCAVAVVLTAAVGVAEGVGVGSWPPVHAASAAKNTASMRGSVSSRGKKCRFWMVSRKQVSVVAACAAL